MSLKHLLIVYLKNNNIILWEIKKNYFFFYYKKKKEKKKTHITMSYSICLPYLFIYLYSKETFRKSSRKLTVQESEQTERSFSRSLTHSLPLYI